MIYVAGGNIGTWGWGAADKLFCGPGYDTSHIAYSLEIASRRRPIFRSSGCEIVGRRDRDAFTFLRAGRKGANVGDACDLRAAPVGRDDRVFDFGAEAVGAVRHGHGHRKFESAGEQTYRQAD